MKKDKEHRKIKLTDAGEFLKNGFLAFLKGEFLLRLKVDRYFPQIAWTFFLFALFILFSFMVDVSLSKIEINKQTLKELEILNTQKRYELVTLNRRSTVSSLLEGAGSKVGEPQQQAIILTK